MIIKKLYVISLISLFLGCGGGSSDLPSSATNQPENNQTTIADISNIREGNETIDSPHINENNSSTETDTQENESRETTESDSNVTDSNSQTEENNPLPDTPQPHTVEIKKRGKAQLGVLSKATVKLYELTKEERRLLATEVTTSGNSIDSIGNFNLHLEKLLDNKLYLYEVSGGMDYDVDDNGVIDETPTQNSGIFHLLALGSHIKALKKINVTIVSELIYQKLKSSLTLEENDIIKKMELFSKEIVEKDINSDGFIGIEDILKYNPILDKTKLQIAYQSRITQVISDVLNNRDSDFDAPIFMTEESTIEINENLTFIKKIEIEDKSQLTITLLGEDAPFFNYHRETQELSFKTPIDFEIPQDTNKDNSFELTIEAIDSYFNRSSQNFLIKVIDINETIPKAPTLEDSTLSIYENNLTNTLLGSITVKNQGTAPIDTFTLLGEDKQLFKINQKGEIFSKEVFDFETQDSYSLKVEATNKIGTSNQATITIKVEDIPDITPTVQDVTLSIFENQAIGTFLGKVNIQDKGDSEISSFVLEGYNHSSFEINPNGYIVVRSYINYESYNLYYLQYRAVNQAGESEKANLTITVKNIFENSGSDYPKTESGIQSALDNSDYSFVLNQLLNNRDAYSGLDDDTVNMNIAGAYVGSSGYTVYDITGAMSDGNGSSFNDFVNNITKNNDSETTINQLKEADTYYSLIVQGLDCNNTAILTQIQKDSCYNLGLVRLTSLTNSVKLLFGGDSDTVEKWAEGVDINSSDDLNGNGVLDASEASACAVVYANNPNDNCKNGTNYAYRGGVQFNQQGREYNLTLIEVDVGNTTNGYQSFYQLISSMPNNNTPILTSGVCDKSFNKTTHTADGSTYFPCPSRNTNGDIMGIKESIENAANIQALFPDGDETKNTLQSYLTNITGSNNGTIGLDNLSTYLRTH